MSSGTPSSVGPTITTTKCKKSNKDPRYTAPVSMVISVTPVAPAKSCSHMSHRPLAPHRSPHSAGVAVVVGSHDLTKVNKKTKNIVVVPSPVRLAVSSPHTHSDAPIENLNPPGNSPTVVSEMVEKVDGNMATPNDMVDEKGLNECEVAHTHHVKHDDKIESILSEDPSKMCGIALDPNVENVKIE